MERFLLTLTERSGEDEHTTNHVIEADNRQKVKYHFHRTLKDMGWTQGHRKHCIERWGGYAEIASISRLDWEEYQILNRYISGWTKV